MFTNAKDIPERRQNRISIQMCRFKVKLLETISGGNGTGTQFFSLTVVCSYTIQTLKPPKADFIISKISRNHVCTHKPIDFKVFLTSHVLLWNWVAILEKVTLKRNQMRLLLSELTYRVRCCHRLWPLSHELFMLETLRISNLMLLLNMHFESLQHNKIICS